MRFVLCAILALSSTPAPVTAQERSFATKLGIETAGGAVGSAAGLGLGLLLSSPERCPSDDLACVLERLSVVGLAATAGAAVGAWQLGEAADTEPSLLGSAIGAIGGAAAGVGILELLKETTSDRDLDPVPAVIAFTLTQGLVTAAFSRGFAALR